MRKLILFLVLTITFPAGADLAIVQGKPHELTPLIPNVCGEIESPENAAARGVIEFAKSFGEKKAASMCAAGATDYCERSAQVKFGLNQLFIAIRKYPSQFTSTGCKDLRNRCVALCSKESVLIAADCAIECGQYESWNK